MLKKEYDKTNKILCCVLSLFLTSSLKMKVVCPSEMVVSTHKSTNIDVYSTNFSSLIIPCICFTTFLSRSSLFCMGSIHVRP